MQVQCNFNGLSTGVTSAHIHAATTNAFLGTAAVATTTPSFNGFPNGVFSGSYNQTIDMSLSSSFNPIYITSHGGTVSQSWIDLKTAITAGKAYFDIHTSTYPGGEIRGFLILGCSSTKTGNWNDVSVWSCGHIPDQSSFVTILASHIVSIPPNITAHAKYIEINGELKKGTNASLALNH